MAISSADQHGLQQAIARALEKEARANGTFQEGNHSVVTYVAIYRIGGSLKRISNTDLEAFKIAVEKVKKAFPALPVTLFETTQEE